MDDGVSYEAETLTYQARVEADGGEKYMLIGNFYGDNVTKYETNKKPKDFSKEQIIAASDALYELAKRAVERAIVDYKDNTLIMKIKQTIS
jgi:hypothetical protein